MSSTSSAAGRGPDFVCIGAQKAGTTWLYDNLVPQETVWVPPVKEIHYFNTVCANEALLGVEDHGTRSFGARYRPLLASPSLATLRWLRRFHREPRTNRWYYSLFPAELVGSRIAGDITPAYSTLDERGVAFARRVLKPGCRVLLIVRDPIERVWSGIKMWYRWKGEDLPAGDVERLVRQAHAPTHRLRSDYATMIRLWGDAFGEDFRVFRYDRLSAAPAEFLHEVGDFLGVAIDTDRLDLGKRSNSDPGRVRIPPSLERALADTFRAEIEAVDALMPGVAADWLGEGGSAPAATATPPHRHAG